VSVDGIDLLSLSEAAMTQYQRSKVGFVWQQTSRNLIPYLTALENVELPMTMAWVTSRREKRAWAEELLQAVGLYERRFHRLNQLSGGEQQRVAIAVALANKPVMLLGDEPTGEVDSVTAQTIMNTFRALCRDMELTTIIVTHDPRIAEQVDRVVAIRDGKISTETIRQVSQLEKAMAGERRAGDLRDAPPKEEVTYQEFVVLDSAGRLQLPKELREQLGIGKRARLEMGEDSIIIRPAAGQGEESAKHLTLEEQLELLFNEEPAPQKKPGSQKWLKKPGRKP
jgi:ABC-type lipoprotein export system ATPase subunit/bifunctional DNA-binding transcriptional regulator/antitoxin component of YhaV-PrlF toxin-antitoxin module